VKTGLMHIKLIYIFLYIFTFCEINESFSFLKTDPPPAEKNCILNCYLYIEHFFVNPAKTGQIRLRRKRGSSIIPYLFNRLDVFTSFCILRICYCRERKSSFPTYCDKAHNKIL